MIGSKGAKGGRFLSHASAGAKGEDSVVWVISYADLVSLLFCTFVLLTTISAAPKNCDGLAKYFENNRGTYKNFELRNSKLECVITLPSDYLFQTGQDTVQRAALDRLRPLVQNIIQLPEHRNDLIIVEGHTDNAPIRTARFPSNWELSSARATNVAAFMRQLGVPTDRMSVRAFADSRPKVSYNDDAGKPMRGQDLEVARRANRRVEILLVNPPNKLQTYALLFH
jgi:flagellar motor protein MotB